MQEIKEFAPVVIPTLNRHVHFRRLIESLAKCTHADKTEVVIGLDYPPSEKYVEGYEKIKEILPTITGFKKVTVLTTDFNLGVVENCRRCYDYVYQYYDTCIFSEDDNEVSPCFLDYMNKALTKYKDNPNVIAISGYNYPIDVAGYDKNVFAFQNFTAWGVGMWKNKVTLPDDFQAYCKKILKSPRLLYKIYKKDWRLMYGITKCAATGVRYGDSIWTLKSILEDKYFIYPTKTLVKNWGFDGTGLHCGRASGKDLLYNSQKISNIGTFVLDDIEISECQLSLRCRKFLTGGFRSRIVRLIKIVRNLMKLLLV